MNVWGDHQRMVLDPEKYSKLNTCSNLCHSQLRHFHQCPIYHTSMICTFAGGYLCSLDDRHTGSFAVCAEASVQLSGSTHTLCHASCCSCRECCSRVSVCTYLVFLVPLLCISYFCVTLHFHAHTRLFISSLLQAGEPATTTPRTLIVVVINPLSFNDGKILSNTANYLRVAQKKVKKRDLVSYCWYNPQPMRNDHSIAGTTILQTTLEDADNTQCYWW